MHKIGVIGDYGSIYGFKALGFDTFPVEESDPGAKLRELASGDYGVIYVTEKVAQDLKSEIDKYSKSILPAIIEIPGTKGNTGEGVENVKLSVEKAIGSDILFSDKDK